VTEGCRDVREKLEAGAAADDREVAAHLAGCSACRAHAALLHVFGELTPGEADEQTVSRIVAALPPAPWLRRRVAGWLPLAAGVALAAIGLVLSGGIPAPSVTSALPGAAGAVAAWIVSSLLDALAAARAGTDAARAAATAGGLWMVLWLVAAGLGGSWAVVSLVGRTDRRRRP
jgi:hypothetical protein